MASGNHAATSTAVTDISLIKIVGIAAAGASVGLLLILLLPPSEGGTLIALILISLLSFKELLGFSKRNSPRLRRELNALIAPLLVVFILNVAYLIIYGY